MSLTIFIKPLTFAIFFVSHTYCSPGIISSIGGPLPENTFKSSSSISTSFCKIGSLYSNLKIKIQVSFLEIITFKKMELVVFLYSFLVFVWWCSQYSCFLKVSINCILIYTAQFYRKAKLPLSPGYSTIMSIVFYCIRVPIWWKTGRKLRPRLDCGNVQTGLNLCCSHMSTCSLYWIIKRAK